MKKSKQHHARRKAKRAPVRASSRSRRSLVVSVVIAVGVVSVVAVSLLLVKKAPKGPQPRVGSEMETTEATADDAVLQDEAFDVVRQLIADFPQSAFPLGLMGTLHNHYGNSVEAEVWWRRCLEKEPARSDVYEVLAVMYLRKGEYQKVVDLSGKANAVDPHMPGVHRYEAEALLEMGRLDDALVAAETEKKIADDPGETDMLLGKIYLQKENYEQALEAYTRALGKRPNDWSCYYGLATASARLGHREEAAEYTAKFNELRAKLDKRIERRMESMGQGVRRRAGPILAETLVDAGRAYHEYRRLQKAEACWQRAAAVDAENTSCRRLLVSLYRNSRRQEDALDVCQQLTRIDPGNASYRVLTGLVLAELGRFDLAEQAMRQSISLAPERAEGYEALARFLLRRSGELAEAKTLAEKAAALEPTARNYALLSTACSRNRDRTGALAAIERAVALAPDNEEFRETYERLQRGNDP